MEANLTLLQRHTKHGKVGWEENAPVTTSSLKSRTIHVTRKLVDLNWQNCSLRTRVKSFLSRPCFSDPPKQSNHLAKQKTPKSPYFNHSWCLTWMPGIFTRTEFVLQPSQFLSLVFAVTFTMANDWHLPWQMSERRICKVIKIMDVHVMHGEWLRRSKYILWCYLTKTSRPSFKDWFKLIKGLFNISVH